jgi:hypothetical protein
MMDSGFWLVSFLLEEINPMNPLVHCMRQYPKLITYLTRHKAVIYIPVLVLIAVLWLLSALWLVGLVRIKKR